MWRSSNNILQSEEQEEKTASVGNGTSTCVMGVSEGEEEENPAGKLE